MEISERVRTFGRICMIVGIAVSLVNIYKAANHGDAIEAVLSGVALFGLTVAFGLQLASISNERKKK